jgi:hypothetical protein
VRHPCAMATAATAEAARTTGTMAGTILTGAKRSLSARAAFAEACPGVSGIGARGDATRISSSATAGALGGLDGRRVSDCRGLRRCGPRRIRGLHFPFAAARALRIRRAGSKRNRRGSSRRPGPFAMVTPEATAPFPASRELHDVLARLERGDNRL